LHFRSERSPFHQEAKNTRERKLSHFRSGERTKVPGRGKFARAKVPRVFAPESERSLLGTFAPMSESTEERKYWRAKRPISVAAPRWGRWGTCPGCKTLCPGSWATMMLTINERNRQQDRRTDRQTPHDGRDRVLALTCSFVRQKKSGSEIKSRYWHKTLRWWWDVLSTPHVFDAPR